MASPEDVVAAARDLAARQQEQHLPTLAARSPRGTDEQLASDDDGGPKVDPGLAEMLREQQDDDEGEDGEEGEAEAEDDAGREEQEQEEMPTPGLSANEEQVLESEMEAAAEAEGPADVRGSRLASRSPSPTTLGKRRRREQSNGAKLREQVADGRNESEGEGDGAAASASAPGTNVAETDAHSADAGTDVGPSTSPRSRRHLPHASRKSAASVHSRRMTVLMDDEMPEGVRSSFSDEGGESGVEEEDEEDEDDDEHEEEGTFSEKDADADSKALPKSAGKEAAEIDDGSRRVESDVEGESEEESEAVTDESEEESETDSEEDSDSDEEVEPSLKYQRLKGGASDILAKDTASALAISDRFLALGTHSGMIYILDVEGNLVKGFRSHSASILDLDIDSSSEFVASASIDGMVSISALSTSEQYVFDFKRPMRCIALEPNFGKRSTRAFVCGGMAGALVQREKSWFGHKEVILHAGEGPIWTVEWRSNLIAWANDQGVRIYDTNTHQRITFISPPSANPRADLFRCSLFWQNDRTLLIAWADHIKVAKIKERKPAQSSGPAVPGVPGLGSQSPQLFVEIAAIFQLDCMISGIAPYGQDYLVLAYLTEDTYDEEATDDREAQRRKEGNRPELRIISKAGEELSSDVLSLHSFARFQCNDYLLVPSADGVGEFRNQKRYADNSHYYVVSPKDIVVARPRDDRDHVEWLLERRRYEEALVRVEGMGSKNALANGFDSAKIGRKYLDWLVEERNYDKAAKVASKILGRNAQAWEDWIFLFVEKGQLGTVIPYVPTSDPQLSGLVYDMILAHFLRINPVTLLKTIKEWPPEIYSTQAVVIAIEDKLQHEQSSPILMECLAELFIANRQPGKALPYFLRLRRPNVFDLIRENNLFTAVQDQALLLIEFEEDLSTKQKEEQRRNAVRKSVMGGEIAASRHGAAIDLLVDHTHSIPIHRVISQLEGRPRYLYMYLDALFDRDPQLASDFSDTQVKLYADYDYAKLMPFLRAMSSYYSFEKAYDVCKERDYVPEMVFLLGRVGDNKRALNLIIERLGDVERAIDFAKEQNDDDLWEDLLRYSETKPAFIRGLLENVGAEIDPIRLIRRIKDGLEIPGLKDALIKILHDFNLQISLLEGCSAILYHDNKTLSLDLHRGQTDGQYCDSETLCASCQKPLFTVASDTYNAVRAPLSVLFLCRHAFHLTCLLPTNSIPASRERPLPPILRTSSASVPSAGGGENGVSAVTVVGAGMSTAPFGPARRADEARRALKDKIEYQTALDKLLRKGCPRCKVDAQRWVAEFVR